MTEQELNKKLAEWAGFTERDYTPLGKLRNGSKVWYDPNENCLYCHLPDFIQSLDACFKWLVPKTVSGDIHIEWYTTADDTAVNLKRATTTVAFVCQPNPALTLCLAIEKLIDSQPLLSL